MPDIKYPLNNKFERVSDLTHAIASFLEWAEEKKGLILCEPYKPQYSWYSPYQYQQGTTPAGVFRHRSGSAGKREKANDR